MAIQIPNPGTGNGATGDNEFVLWSKVKDNFSDATHAASKLVGKATTQIALNIDVNEVAFRSTKGTIVKDDESITTLGQFPDGGTHHIGTTRFTDMPYSYQYTNLISFSGLSTSKFQIFHGYGNFATYDLYMRSGVSPDAWMKIYHDKNTKLDTNGAIAPSSPTIDLYSDRIETNADGGKMNPEFVRNGVGDYTIKNTTGLRDEGWYIKIPNDMNGNPKVAVAIDTDKDGNLSIKTYKRTFSMETFTFNPDLETPLDIPEGRWIDLRFNDLPLDDIQSEEVDLDK